MKKEYVTVRLFNNNRSTDGLITKEELHDLDQQKSSETLNNSHENNETVESYAKLIISYLPQRLLVIIQNALAALSLDRKG